MRATILKALAVRGCCCLGLRILKELGSPSERAHDLEIFRGFGKSSRIERHASAVSARGGPLNESYIAWQASLGGQDVIAHELCKVQLPHLALSCSMVEPRMKPPPHSPPKKEPPSSPRKSNLQQQPAAPWPVGRATRHWSRAPLIPNSWGAGDIVERLGGL